MGFDVAGPQHFAQRVLLRRMHAGRGIAGSDGSAVIDPADHLQFGVLADQRLGAAGEFGRVDLAVAGVAGQAHQLFLALQQAQAQALLRIFHVTAHGLLLALLLFQAQVAEGDPACPASAGATNGATISAASHPSP